MTREELKEHCERQIQQFERVEKIMPVTPNSWKRYEEHKLILELLEQEPCEDVIDRAEAMTEIMMFAGNVKSDEEDIYIKVSDAVQLLRDLPSVTAQSKKGHWIKIGAYQGKCSYCNNCVIDEDENFGDYCRHCGSDMRGDE